LNNQWLDMGRTKQYGIAFGDGLFMSSPPSRSQIWARACRGRLPESGFGGWADEKIKTAREAVPYCLFANHSAPPGLSQEKTHPQLLVISRPC
jgi:hypothetical protein